MNFPHVGHNEITKIFGNKWVVTSAWRVISIINIEGILYSIKSMLLKFLLELSEELGETESLDIIRDTKKIDKLFESTIGNMKGETINISIGSENVQSVNIGPNSSQNIAKGN